MQDENVINPETSQEAEKIIVHQPEQPAMIEKNKPFFHFDSNTLLGLILLAGLVVLYVLYFQGREKTGTLAVSNPEHLTGTGLSVVFVNIDSLNLNYEYVKVLRGELEKTGKKYETEVLSEQSALEKEAAVFQNQISSNAIAEDKAKIIYEGLMQKQQALMQKKDQYTQLIAEQEMHMNLKLVDSVTAFLKRFNRMHGFDYIMGFKTGGEILVSSDSLDITRQVLDALNKEYAGRKK